MLWERPDRGATLGSLEPDLSRCFVCGCGRPISPAFAPSRRSGQECDFFGRVGASGRPAGAAGLYMGQTVAARHEISSYCDIGIIVRDQCILK